MRPHLKQAQDLTAADFEAYPVWINVHGLDEGEPWYEETDEATFRPWTGGLPASPSEGMLLVSATLQLADGATYRGIATPTFHDQVALPDALGYIQPQLFTPLGESVFFWLGMFPEREQINSADRALQRTPEQVFPATFWANEGLTTGLCAGEIPGFCSIPGGSDAPLRIEK